MNDEGKRKIVEFVGLKWHGRSEELSTNGQCTCGGDICICGMHLSWCRDNIIDPTTCCGMAKVWEAFEDDCGFFAWLTTKKKHDISKGCRVPDFHKDTFLVDTAGRILIDTKQRAEVLLEYIEAHETESEKE